MQLTIKRLDLIAALEAKRDANQKSYDAACVTSTEAEDFCKNLITKAFGVGALNTKINAQGYSKSQAIAGMDGFLMQVGAKSTAVPVPYLFTKELTVLRLATEDTLLLDTGESIFSFLA